MALCICAKTLQLVTGYSFFHQVCQMLVPWKKFQKLSEKTKTNVGEIAIRFVRVHVWSRTKNLVKKNCQLIMDEWTARDINVVQLKCMSAKKKKQRQRITTKTRMNEKAMKFLHGQRVNNTVIPCCSKNSNRRRSIKKNFWALI